MTEELKIINPHAESVDGVLSKLQTSEHGLDIDTAKRRLEHFGPNKLEERKADSLFVIFARQFQSPLIYVLIVAAGIVFAMGEIIDGSLIVAVLLFNAIVGTFQEGKAQNTLLVLKQFAETMATVRREEKEILIPDEEVVPGDILILQEGEKVPADARVLEAIGLKVNEASLTGESEPVEKEEIELPLDTSVADRKNMLFKGTNVLSGSGMAVATGTGNATEIGKIAKEIATIDTEIPLKKNIRALSNVVIAAALTICIALSVAGLLRGESLTEMFTMAVALSVAVIPEGLPVVITLVLATGVWRMSKRHAQVKRLQAVEALGQTRVIAVDKTGTLTRNEMVVQRAFVNDQEFVIMGSGYEAEGKVLLDGIVADPAENDGLMLCAEISLYCSRARITRVQESWRVAGDPTEAATLVFAEKIRKDLNELRRSSPLIVELPFEHWRKFHATVRERDGNMFLSVVGAPEAILRMSSSVWADNCKAELSDEKRAEYEKIVLQFAEQGYRIVGLGFYADAENEINLDELPELTFVGFLAIRDALRPEVHDAVKKIKAAGMRIVMITGDHEVTARVVAEEAGIFREGDKILTGRDLQDLNAKILDEELGQTTVFARVTPEDKLRIIEAYRRRGEIVAMTGDGVNDAPSLMAADLGVAMGKIGTEVAKEAADIVLLDDNFGSIVAAVEEGRAIYRTVKRVILYLFSCNIGEVLTIAGAMFLGLPLPILAAQIIWLNFVTDAFLDVGLAMEPKGKGLLQGKYVRPGKWILNQLMVQRIFLMALTMSIGTLYLFSKYVDANSPKAWTISLTTLAVFQWFNAWNCRSESKSIFQMNPFSNLYLVGSTLIVILLQIVAIYTPFLERVLRTEALSWEEWQLILSLGFSIVVVEEIRKFFYRRSRRAEFTFQE